MLDSCDFLCTWRWVKSTLVLLSYFLDKGTVVVADAYGETNLVISVSLKALETSLDFLNLCIHSQVVLENQMDCICGHSATLSHQHPLAVLVETNI